MGSSLDIVKGNNLIFARYSVPYNALRFLLVASAKIERDDIDFLEYSIEVSELIELFGLKDGKHLYSEMDKLTDYLPTTLIKVPTDEGLKKYGLVASSIYIEGEGIVKFSFHPDIKEYLLQLKENFTKYDLRNVLFLPNAYIIRLYEILKSREYRKSLEISFLELKEILGIPEDKYVMYGNFKDKVLMKAQEHLKAKTDITFKFEGIKTGRKVTHIKFTISPQKRVRELPKKKATERNSIQNLDLFNRIVSYGVSEHKAITILSSYEEVHIIENLNIVDKKHKDGGVENLGGFTIDAIVNDYAQSIRADNIKKQEQKSDQLKQKSEAKDKEDKEAQEVALYIESIYTEMQKHDYTNATDAFVNGTNIFTQRLIKDYEVNPQDYSKSPYTRNTFARYLASIYLPEYWHTFEDWKASQTV